MTSRRNINDNDITELRKLLQSTDTELITSSDTESYKKSISRWSSAAEKPAGACLIPKSNEGISIALKYAHENHIEVAVKGGGHSSAGASSTDGGLLIDMNTHMRTTEVDVKNKSIKVGGGALWGDVDAALNPYGLATVGGTAADTGVGGLALGGGFGWLSIKYGLVCDNILECTTVLADGRIVKASNTENTDLFWALRGAGQNFGVTTEFIFRTYEQGNLWAGFVVYPAVPEIINKVIEFSNKLYAPESNGKCAAAGVAAGGLGFAKPPQAGGQTMFMVPISYNGPEEEGKAMFKDLLDLGPVMSTMASVSYEQANKLMPIPYGLRVSMKGAAFELPLRPEFVHSALESFSKFTDDVPDAAGSYLFWELIPSDAILKVSNSATAFANRGDHMNALVAPMWTDPKNDQACRTWARDLSQVFKKDLQARGAEAAPSNDGFIGKRGDHGATMIYGNYDQYEEKSKDVFGMNYERLQEIKAKYDPHNMFNKLFPITPSTGTP